MKRYQVTPDHLFQLADRGVDPARELDLIGNIGAYVSDAHAFSMAYANYAQTVFELCSGLPEPVSQFLRRWPHRKASL